MKNKKNYYRILQWDSKLFGYSVAKLTRRVSNSNLNDVLKELKTLKVKLVYWFVKPTDLKSNEVAIVHNGIIVDKKVTFIIPHSKYIQIAQDNKLVQSYISNNVSQEIISLALQSGLYSRFFIDSHFVQNEYEKLYSIWIINSVMQKKAFNVIVYYDEKGSEKGLMSLESKGKYGSIGLFAVDKHFRGKSIGKTLVKKAFAEFGKRGYRNVYVTTQGENIIACHFYESVGFQLYKTENVYHFWL